MRVVGEEGLWTQIVEGRARSDARGRGVEGAAAAYGGGRAGQPATRSYLGGAVIGAAGTIAIGIQLDDIDITSSREEGVGGSGDGVAAIGGLNDGAAPFISTVRFAAERGPYDFGPLESSIGIQLDDIGKAKDSFFGEGGGAGDGVAAIGGLNDGAALFIAWSADGFGPLEVTIGIQLDDIDISFSCAEGGGGAGDGVAAIGGLNERVANVWVFSADGFGPLEVTIGIQLDDIDISFSCAEGGGVAGDGVAAIGGLNDGVALFIAWSADGFGPLEVSIGIQFDDIDISFSCAEGFGGASDDVAAIGGLNEGAALLSLRSADGFGPLEVSIRIQFDDIDISFSCAEGGGGAGDGVAAIGGLNEGAALLSFRSADGFGPLEVSMGV